jgi:micrococcal nuclease
MAKKLDPWIYNAKLIKGVDGDTADAFIDCGFNISVKKRIRFKGVDTWESRTRNLEEKKLGLKAKAYTLEMLSRNDGKFTVKSHGVGKYGRLLGEIFIKGEEKSLNQLLIDNGHAAEYEGGKKRVFGNK